MIVYKTWKKYKRDPFLSTYWYEGWFLFGVIPLYIKRTVSG